MTTTPQARKIAVIGSGVAGLVAAHVLAKSDQVTLFEADDRLGGHADTHEVVTEHGVLPIDTGFIVHNDRTYPTLLRLFDELEVATQETDMSMSVRDDATGLEYAGALGLRGLFPSPANLRNPRFLRMLIEVKKFHRLAQRVLATSGEDETLRSFLNRGGFSTYFVDNFMTPLVAAVWSCDDETALDYPARYLFEFLHHHGMLSVFGSPAWRTVVGGSREYVQRVAKNLHQVHLNSAVTRVRDLGDQVEVVADQTYRFDAVVIATHPDQALAMLADPTPAQREVLGAIRYSKNLAQLHTDERLLPRMPGARASWNYQRSRSNRDRVLVTYDMTRLQRLPESDERFLVTLGGEDIVDPDRVLATMDYAHPIFDRASVAAQARLSEINSPVIAFAGAYHGWGFHEDGALSGLRAAEHLGGRWQRAERAPTPRVYRTQIAHARTEPLRNVFRYRSETWLVDLDALPAGFYPADHVGEKDRSLRANIDSLLAEHGYARPARIQMLAHPRRYGYVFNPISVYWCFDADEAVQCCVLEVHNTYGGRHAYVVRPDEHGHAQVAKALYVSPFNDTSGYYTVRVPRPTSSGVHVSVTLHREGHRPFVATMTGTAAPSTRTSRLRSAIHPAPVLGSLRIRLQGIKLWARGLSRKPRPHLNGFTSSSERTPS